MSDSTVRCSDTGWLHAQRPWVVEAYANDPTIHTMVKAAITLGTHEDTLYRSIAWQLYEEKVALREMLARAVAEGFKV